MSLFVNRYVALTFESETLCKAFHKRIREMFVRNSSDTWLHDDGVEEIMMEAVDDDEPNWNDQLGYVFKGEDEAERLFRIWTMGADEAEVKLAIKDMFESDPRTLLIVSDHACWGPELFSCFCQYMDGDFGLEQVKVLLWYEDNQAEVWCQNSDGVYFYNKLDSGSFNSKRAELAEEQELEDASDVEDVEVLKATGVLDDDSEYDSHCEALDNINMDDYPVFYDDSESDKHDDVADEGSGGVTYQGVFDRVKEYLENNGYYPVVNQKDGSVSMAMDGDGGERMLWNSIEDFLTAPWDGRHHAEFEMPGCANIFEIAEGWESRYDKLLRWPATFIDCCGDLAQIDYSDRTPAGLMRALDEASFGENGNDDSEEDDGTAEDDDLEENDDEGDEASEAATNLTESEEPVGTACSEQRFCEQCGSRLEPGCAFCTECGASIDDAPVRSDGDRSFYLPGWMRNAKNGGRQR